MRMTAQNYTPSETLLLEKKESMPTGIGYHELKLDLGTFCALLWVIFKDCCDYFKNCFTFLTMLDSENKFANEHHFIPLIFWKIRWAALNGSRQYFFPTLTVDNFASGNV